MLQHFATVLAQLVVESGTFGEMVAGLGPPVALARRRRERVAHVVHALTQLDGRRVGLVRVLGQQRIEQRPIGQLVRVMVDRQGRTHAVAVRFLDLAPDRVPALPRPDTCRPRVQVANQSWNRRVMQRAGDCSRQPGRRRPSRIGGRVMSTISSAGEAIARFTFHVADDAPPGNEMIDAVHAGTASPAMDGWRKLDNVTSRPVFR